jgi:hypothetical protein
MLRYVDAAITGARPSSPGQCFRTSSLTGQPSLPSGPVIHAIRSGNRPRQVRTKLAQLTLGDPTGDGGWPCRTYPGDQ